MKISELMEILDNWDGESEVKFTVGGKTLCEYNSVQSEDTKRKKVGKDRKVVEEVTTTITLDLEKVEKNGNGGEKHEKKERGPRMSMEEKGEMIMKAMDELGGEASPQEIKKETGLEFIQAPLKKLEEEEMIVKKGHGKYALVEGGYSREEEEESE